MPKHTTRPSKEKPSLLEPCEKRSSGIVRRPWRPKRRASWRRWHAAALGEDELGWRARLRAVRRVAVKLALAGRLVITRKGKVVDPADFRGVYRLGALRQD